MSRKKKNGTSSGEWLKVMAGLVIALAATAAAGHTVSGPAERSATTCVTLQTLPLVEPAV
jgi:hypothetical protein